MTGSTVDTPAPTAAGTERLDRLRVRAPDLVAAVARLVEVESPSGDTTAIQQAVSTVQDLAVGLLGTTGEVIEIDGVPHLLLGPRRGARLLLLGHLDTVWPAGSLARLPCTIDNDRLTGPGCFDMKTGVVQGLFALADAGAPPEAAFLLTGDEEVGSSSSRELIESVAAEARAVFVLEASADGALKTERKGVGMYRVQVTGRAAHAGLDPEKGVNALLELAAFCQSAHSLRSPEQRTTVTPARAQAGSTANTVPAAAWADIDVRATTMAELQRVDAALRAIRPLHPAARLEINGGINRPPMEQRYADALFAKAQTCAARLGLAPLTSAQVGGGSDGNFTAALGIPTLDGLGAVGDGAHADHEHVQVSAIAERTALLAELIETVLS
jgi:glutamate carboxypeptidase